jgi:hypothetical protein
VVKRYVYFRLASRFNLGYGFHEAIFHHDVIKREAIQEYPVVRIVN